MLLGTDDRAVTAMEIGNENATAIGMEIGKRYRCSQCATEVIVTRPGPNEPSCCQQPMSMLAPRHLPSSD
jgi:hypothetical protein